jgi:solute carrier family 25 protein 14/30
MANPGKFSGLPAALLHVGKTYGPFGYFRGFAAQWARFGPYATVQFICWEQLRKWTGLPGI